MDNIKLLSPKPGVELLAVKVPEGAHSFIVKGGRLIYDDNGNNCWWPHIDLPSDNWQILGLSDQLSEEVCRELVSYDFFFSNVFQKNLKNYKDYSNDEYRMIAAKEAFASFLQANEVYGENPIPKPVRMGPFMSRGNYTENQIR